MTDIGAFDPDAALQESFRPRVQKNGIVQPRQIGPPKPQPTGDMVLDHELNKQWQAEKVVSVRDHTLLTLTSAMCHHDARNIRQAQAIRQEQHRRQQEAQMLAKARAEQAAREGPASDGYGPEDQARLERAAAAKERATIAKERVNARVAPTLDGVARVVCSGYVQKKSRKLGIWRKRWLVLSSSGKLLSFDHKVDNYELERNPDVLSQQKAKKKMPHITDEFVVQDACDKKWQPHDKLTTQELEEVPCKEDDIAYLNGAEVGGSSRIAAGAASMSAEDRRAQAELAMAEQAGRGTISPKSLTLICTDLNKANEMGNKTFRLKLFFKEANEAREWYEAVKALRTCGGGAGGA